MNMLTDLETAFIEMDAENLAKQNEWALGRKAALVEFKASEEYQSLRRDQWKLYDRMFAICNGKGWFRVINDNNENGIREFVVKNCKAIADKRNATIVAKLTKIGVTEIGALEYNRTGDGFNGFFRFNDAWIEIRTIVAGGYNIQCLHERTLVYAGGKRI
jgi:hypothetical protein